MKERLDVWLPEKTDGTIQLECFTLKLVQLAFALDNTDHDKKVSASLSKRTQHFEENKHSIILPHVKQSSGIGASFERVFKYPKKCLHSTLFSNFANGFLTSPSETVTFLRSLLILVIQRGHA